MKLKANEIANGAIGENKNKTHPKAPDFTGGITTPMGNFRISIWKLTNPQGEDFLSFSITNQQKDATPGEVAVKPKKVKAKTNDWLSPLFNKPAE